MAKISFTVTFDVPPGASREECLEYVRMAVLAECGCRDPATDPMQRFDRDSLVVNFRKK